MLTPARFHDLPWKVNTWEAIALRRKMLEHHWPPFKIMGCRFERQAISQTVQFFPEKKCVFSGIFFSFEEPSSQCGACRQHFLPCCVFATIVETNHPYQLASPAAIMCCSKQSSSLNFSNVIYCENIKTSRFSSQHTTYRTYYLESPWPGEERLIMSVLPRQLPHRKPRMIFVPFIRNFSQSS